MDIKPIKSVAELNDVLEKMDLFWSFPVGSKEFNLFEVYALLVEDYQKSLCIHDYPDPIEAIRFFMRERGLTLQNLASLWRESCEHTQAIFNRKEKMTTEGIWKLVSVWGMAPASLIKPYELKDNSVLSNHESIQHNSL